MYRPGDCPGCGREPCVCYGDDGWWYRLDEAGTGRSWLVFTGWGCLTLYPPGSWSPPYRSLGMRMHLDAGKHYRGPVALAAWRVRRRVAREARRYRRERYRRERREGALVAVCTAHGCSTARRTED